MTNERMEGQLSEDEALLTQQYATQQEEAGFSEKASPETYAEAQKIIEQLRQDKFDWVGIDWDNIDLRNVGGSNIEARLNAALQAVLESGGSKEDLNEGVRKPSTLRRVLPWMAAASTLLAACQGSSPDAKTRENFTREFNEIAQAAERDTNIVTEGDQWMVDRVLIAGWKEAHPEVERVVVGEIKLTVDESGKPQQAWGSEVTVFLKSGRVFTTPIVGRYSSAVGTDEGMAEGVRQDRAAAQGVALQVGLSRIGGWIVGAAEK